MQDTPQTGSKSGAERFLPENLRAAFDRAVVAGQRLMFSEQMKEMIEQLLATQDPPEKKVAEGIAGLMGALMQKSKPQFPPQLVVPVAVELAYEGVQFLTEAGKIEPLSEEQMRTAIQATIALVVTKMGAKPEQVRAMMSGQRG